ncbi:unnamed protein product [Allacma fusca]|uniref:Peroxidase n=1 Tax=Allacma fusca TaxID=39272 RepID=A0A8J2KPZ1_9HEXA|nr:unnamed protein product [Allacma fusca]
MQKKYGLTEMLVLLVLAGVSGVVSLGLVLEFQEDPTVTNLVNQALEEARNTVPIHVEPGHGHHGHNNSHSYCKFTASSEKIGRFSNHNLRAYDILTRRFNMPKRMVIKLLHARSPEFCHRQVVDCNPYAKYRHIDGSCNNLQNTLWGASFTPFGRLVPAVYQDGYNAPKGGYADSNLPNPRVVSASIHHDFISPDPSITNMVPQVGQFLDHDMTLTPESDHHCCSPEVKDVDCLPIQIFPNDPFYSKLRKPQLCMDFTRSTPYCFPGTNGIREQFNILTAYVDASMVYGSEDVRGRQLREFIGGRLRNHHVNPKMMPEVDQVRALTGEGIEFMGYFMGGDERVNEMPALTVMHTLLFREHNRLAAAIQARRPVWSDEQIYQEARRLLIAEWQNVVYGEYLPIILGDQTMARFGLTLTPHAYSSYDDKQDPTIYNSFATAAYRFGHTLINGLVRLMVGLQEIGFYRVRDHFFDPSQVLQNNGAGYDWILGGLMAQNAQTYDPFVTEDLGNFVLKKKEHDFGGDLLARNLQRGREHGIQGYTIYRQICGMTPLSTWDVVPPEVRPEAWARLRQLYADPADIDLFTGGLVEFPVLGAISGPTFNCLKARQFARLKHGDRFFFTHGAQAGSFSPDQLDSLRRVNLGDLICQNSNLTMTTLNVFKVPGLDNPWLFCNDPQRGYLNIEQFLV